MKKAKHKKSHFLKEAVELTNTAIKPHEVYFIDNKPTLKPYMKTISKMVDAAYAPLGGYTADSSPKSLFKNTDRAKVVFDKDNLLIAVSLYRTDLGGYKMFCCAGIPGNKESVEAVNSIVQDDIKFFNNWYWTEVSGALEHLFKKNNSYPIPNVLAKEFLRIKVPNALQLDSDMAHYTRLSGKAHREIKKIIFGFKDKASAEKATNAVKDYEDFRLRTNKLVESDTEVDIACDVIRQIFEFHDEWQCNEMLPEWDKQIKIAIKKVREALSDKNVTEDTRRMYEGVLRRAQSCTSEMPRLWIKRFKLNS